MSTVKLAFTSCMDVDADSKQPVWNEIQKQKPHALFLLGDQIYMDWKLKPKWKRKFAPPGGPQDFAQTMHQRYEAQWQVKTFRDLIAWVVANHGPDALFVTWDEHDMAWNNAYGEYREDGADEPHSDPKHGVPPLARNIAHRLFRQFVGVLQEGKADAKYPALPADILASPTVTRGVQRDGKIGAVEIVLLDERFYRTARDNPDVRLLGPSQLAGLKQKVSTGKGLIVVAGSSPLTHRYAVSSQGWDGKRRWLPDEPPYPDFKAFCDAARRPVLYVGGDIHRAAYTGLLPGTNIVQALASGAARGTDYRAEPGSFAVAEIDPGLRMCTVQLHSHRGLIAKDEAHYLDDGWNTALGGLAGRELPFLLDPRPLDVALLRQHGAVPARCAPQALDELFKDKLPKPEVAEALSVLSHPEGVDLSLAQGADAMKALFERAAQRALDNDCLSLVLFVHAFDKPMAESVEQALLLRQRYPRCEPVLFSWPSGDHGVAELPLVLPRINECARALAGVLPTFIQAASDRQLMSVLLVRSLGARMLDEGGVPAAAKGLQRLVLSAPAMRENGHAAKLDAFSCDTFVTINREDKTLKLPSLLSDQLGDHRPDTLGQRTLYLDCTEVDDADDSHDYFLDGGHGDRLQVLHERLLYGAAVSANALPPGFIAAPQQAQLLIGLPE